MCVYICIIYLYIYYMKWFCWRLPKKSSISLFLSLSLSRLQEREGTVEKSKQSNRFTFSFLWWEPDDAEPER